MGTHQKEGSKEMLKSLLPLTEGFVGVGFENIPNRNVFGRNIQFSFQGDIAHNIGLASTGLRTLAFIKGSAIKKLAPSLTQAVGQQLATSVIVEYDRMDQIQELMETGAFVFSASSWQEVLDFACLSMSVSERTLIPGVVVYSAALANSEFKTSFDIPQLKEFLGNPDRWIDSPTPAQKLIFGEKRKQLPNWFDPDLPVTIGTLRSNEDLYFEKASSQEFIQSHLVDELNSAKSRLHAITGRSFEWIQVSTEKRSNLAVLTSGVDQLVINESRKSFKETTKSSVSSVQLTLLSPFPSVSLNEILSKFDAVSVLENSLKRSIYNRLKGLQNPRNLYSGLYHSLGVTDLLTSMENMIKGNVREYWLNIPISQEKSRFPKHDVLLHSVNRDYPEAIKKNVLSSAIGLEKSVASTFVPQKVRQLRDNGPAYTKVSRFFDDMALMYNLGERSAEPFQSLNILPSDTASFKDIPREHLPVVKTEDCTACGDCFIVCPHSALPPSASTVSNLIKGAMAKSKENGRVLKSLTPLVKTIATLANKELKAKKEKLSNLGSFFLFCF